MHPRRSTGIFAGGALLLCGLLSLSGTTVEPDVRKVDPQLLHPHAVAAGTSARPQTDGAATAADTAIPIFVRLVEDDPDLPGKFLGLGGSAKRIAPRVYLGKTPPDAIRHVSNWPNIAYIEGSKRVRRMLDRSRPAVSAGIVQTGTPGFPPPFDTTGLKGDNVYLGFVDTGLYGAHADFHINGTGSSRIVHTYSAPGISFPTSTDPLVDEDGHGTHVAGIAAGNGFSAGGTYAGMAPDAEMMIGKSSFTTTDIAAAIQDLIDFAESRARPVAINLSLGLVAGSHDGTSGFESAVNSLATGALGSRRLIAVASGNEQDQKEHFRTVVGDPFGSGTVSLTLHSTLSSFLPQIEIWANGAIMDPNPAKRTEYDEYTVSVTFPDDAVTVPSGRLLTSPNGSITVSNRVDTGVSNGATHITISLDQTLARKTGTIRFDRTRNGGTGVIDGYVDIYDGFFPAPALTGNVIEPANGDNVVAVGSFATKAFDGSAVFPQAISSFSSLGPTRDGRLKPDIVAPGEYLYSTRSFDAPSSNYSGIVSTNPDYAIDAGTSMATPHVTGVAALVWQSNPSLTGAQMRERLRRTANPPTDGSTPPNTTWGYGKLNALRAVQNTVASITAPAAGVPGVSVPLASGNSSGAFGNAIAYAWSLAGRPGGSTSSLSSTSPSASFTPDSPGNYTVSLTASQLVPAGTSQGVATAVIHVNHVPTAAFSVPASDNAGKSVTFASTVSDADTGQSMTRHWLLVSRPAGSVASITAANVPNSVFTPDAQGTYEIGLRADDGLDNSALVVHSYTALNPMAASSSSGGGGGGCLSITRSDGLVPVGTSLFSLGILLLPACALGMRRFIRRQGRTVPIRHPIC